MTCIVGLVHSGKVFIGADSASAAGSTVRETALPKVFRRGDFVIGYTTSFRMGQLLQYVVEIPKAEVYDLEYMVTQFAEAVRLKFKEYGFTKIDSNQEIGGTFLVGVAGQLFEIASDFQVNTYRDGMAAVGCGCDFALGALQALAHLSPEERIRRALEVSDYFSGWVMPPFQVLEA
jgi:ATP-dependent protease HslVU (ClpYQ) peptidase subunit